MSHMTNAEENVSVGVFVGVFLKWWVFPPNHPWINRVFHYTPSILGYPYFRKHPYLCLGSVPSALQVVPNASRVMPQACHQCGLVRFETGRVSGGLTVSGMENEWGPIS